MRRKTSLRELLKFKPSKGPGFEIKPSFYLSVMAAKMPLPSIRQVVEPQGENGAIKGFGVPLAGNKEDLERPMERGVYAIASIDRKTVLRATVISKEEAGFDPEPFLRSELASELSDEMKSRMRATWTLVQITFESFDPEIYPAVLFALAVAERIALLTEGLVADPVSQVYKMPGELISAPPENASLNVADVVHMRHKVNDGKLHIFTLGLQKFGLSELEIQGINPVNHALAVTFLLNVAQLSLNGAGVEVGNTLGANKERQFQVTHGGLDKSIWQGVEAYELIPQGTEDVNTVLVRWVRESD